MENEYLSEEKYEKTKRKIIKISLIIFILGLVIGGGLITSGFLKKNELEKQHEKEITEKEKESEKNKEESSKRAKELDSLIDETQTKLDAAKVELTKLMNEKSKIFEQDRGFSDRYYKKDEEITAKRNEINNLESKISSYKSELTRLNYSDTYNSVVSSFKTNSLDESEYVPRFMFGVFIIVAFSMIALGVYFTAKRREITAFAMQQSLPIAKEGIEKMSSSVGAAVKEITKGIEEGKAEAKVPHVVRCPRCGADNEIIGRTGKCEYCKSKIAYKE